MATIFVLEDNVSILETITTYLQLADFTVQGFETVDALRAGLRLHQPDLLILDVMLPDGHGFSVARQVRQSHPTVPFLFVTARESESDRITGLELGAEDYIVKPFSGKELALRVAAITRRTGPASNLATPAEESWRIGPIELKISRPSHQVWLNQALIDLTATEWNILQFLVDRPGIVVSRDQILGDCLDYQHDGSARTVNTHIKNLRAKLGQGEWIETVRGFGYRFGGRR